MPAVVSLTLFSINMIAINLSMFNFTDCDHVLTQTNGSIISPEYPANYPHSIECTWSIQLNSSSPLLFKFNEFQTQPDQDILEVIDGTKSLKFSGQSKRDDFILNSNLITLRFKSDDNLELKGFNISYQIVETGNYSRPLNNRL